MDASLSGLFSVLSSSDALRVHLFIDGSFVSPLQDGSENLMH